MIESAISSHHHFYVFFFQSGNIKSLGFIPRLFEATSDYKIISVKKAKELEFCHLQLEINRMYGTESALNLNLSRTTKKYGAFYWYDFYIGKIEISGTNYFFICYPYSKLGKYLENTFHSKMIETVFYKPDLSIILDYMRDRNTKGLSKMEKQGLVADIIRYSADVQENDKSSNKVNIIGENPLKSKTYELLNSSKDITVETTSLKLRCKQLDVGDVEISFDRLGNYRFWLRRNAQQSSIPLIPYVFKFFMEIAPLTESNFISSNTLLEDD